MVRTDKQCLMQAWAPGRGTLEAGSYSRVQLLSSCQLSCRRLVGCRATAISGLKQPGVVAGLAEPQQEPEHVDVAAPCTLSLQSLHNTVEVDGPNT